jgi:predicted DCC family thiol-disulfide oxidoreductase YuxK
MDSMATPYTILFDGECHVCSRAVRFIVKRDPHRHFQFAALQSPIGIRLMEEKGLDSETLDSVIVMGNGLAWTQSDAILLILRHLGGAWPLLTIFRLVPGRLRDALYRWFARKRYRWFGKRMSCMVPTPTIRERFLSD